MLWPGKKKGITRKEISSLLRRKMRRAKITGRNKGNGNNGKKN